MMANRKLARNTADIGFHEFRRQLEYKPGCRRGAGNRQPLVPQQQALFRLRSPRGRTTVVHPGADLRVWGRSTTRDMNAARKLRRHAFNRGSCTRINACREEGSGAGLRASVKPASRKQESAMAHLGMD